MIPDTAHPVLANVAKVLRRVPHGVLFRLLLPANRLLDRWETRSSGIEPSLPLPERPVFIIGPPRSGSTLLYQTITKCFDFAYMTNLHAYLYGAPSVAERPMMKWRNQRAIAFSSTYGKTAGLWGPSECPDYWYRFFPTNRNYVPVGDISENDMNRMRTSLRAFMCKAGRPIIFKNLYNSIRVEPLATWVPEAAFIVVQRHMIGNAHSILEGRFKANGNYEDWWSVPVPDVDRLVTEPPHVQAVEQVRKIHGLIDKGLTRLPRSQILNVSYEELCKNPKNVIAKVESFFRSVGVTANREPCDLHHFTPRNDVRIDSDLYERLCEYVSSGAKCSGHALGAATTRP